MLLEFEKNQERVAPTFEMMKNILRGNDEIFAQKYFSQYDTPMIPTPFLGLSVDS